MSGRPHDLIPPEGVPVSFRISSAGSRFGAQILDIVITFGGLFLFFLALIWLGFANWSLMATLFLLLSCFLRIPYYIFSELVWNGRTLGKRMVKVRVVSTDGGRLTPHQIVARNLMKEVEVFMPLTTLLSGSFEGSGTGMALMLWMLLVLGVPLFNKRRQRLGDMIAGTLVVDQPRAILMPDLAAKSKLDRVEFAFEPHHLEIYGRYELQTLEEILRAPPKTPDAIKRMSRIAQTIHRKIGYTDRMLPEDYWHFLTDFYRQQREFLESRQLFGDARENKFHDTRGADE